MQEFKLINLDGTVRYTVIIKENTVYTGYQDYGASSMSGSSGGGMEFSFEDFLNGENHEWVKDNFSKNELNNLILEVQKRTK